MTTEEVAGIALDEGHDEMRWFDPFDVVLNGGNFHPWIIEVMKNIADNCVGW